MHALYCLKTGQDGSYLHFRIIAPWCICQGEKTRHWAYPGGYDPLGSCLSPMSQNAGYGDLYLL